MKVGKEAYQMTIQELIAGESKSVEFKESLPEKSIKYMKTVVAFANGNGGKLIFGIQDNTCEVVGIPDDDIFKTMDAITNAISDSCEPAIIQDISLQTIADKTIIIVEISAGRQRPYYIKSQGLENGTYIRVSGTTRVADSYMVKELLFEGSNRYFDQTPCTGYTVTKEEIDKLCHDLKETALKNTRNEAEKAEVKDVTVNTLLSWGVLVEKEGALVPTNAFALLAGSSVLQAKIQCAVFKGTTRSIFVNRREYEGAIQEQVELAYEFVLQHIQLGAKIEGLYRQDEYEFPIASIREIIANAAAHRSYLEPGNIQIALYDDRLEVTSPGMLLNGVTLEKMRAGYSKVRNRAIASAFSYMKIIEQWGSGIPRMFDEFKEYGLREPELIDLDGDFRVNFYRNMESNSLMETTQTTQSTTQTTQSIQLTDQDKQVLRIIAAEPSITQQKLALEIGWSVDRVKYYTKKLRGKDILRRNGTSRNGTWEIIIGEDIWQN